MPVLSDTARYTLPNTARYAHSAAHQRRAHALIPGGCHTYAKGDDQMPEWAPIVVARGEGAYVWDLDGNRYIEYGQGLRSVTLGHAEPRVVAAVTRALADGSSFTRPAAIELEAAEALLGLVPDAEMVKFGKHGSDVVTAATTLARATTGRDRVAICNAHPFLAQHDWFIGTTPLDAGIPETVKALTLTFAPGDADALDVLFNRFPDEIAAVVLDLSRCDDAGYLRAVEALCRRHGAVLVFDEMISGFRCAAGGAHTALGVTPDLACFGKALANGFSVSALCGRRDLMARGGLYTDEPRVFLLSATHGAETHALAAALEVMRIYETEDVPGRLAAQGCRLREGVEAAAAAAGVQGQFEIVGHDANLVFVTRDAGGQPSQPFRTLFLQELLRRGVLAPSFVVSTAHTDEVLDQTVEAVAEALGVYRRALDEGLDGYLLGRSVQPVFRRYA